jgi:hypothetical protein
MRYVDSAAATLDVAIVGRTGWARIGAWGYGIVSFLWIFVAAPTGYPEFVILWDITVTRRDSGEAILRRAIGTGSESIAESMRSELTRYTEARWLERWGDPSTWGA